MLDDIKLRVFEVDGRKLHYRDAGAGFPVLILHGGDLHIPGSWDRAVAALLAAGYRVVFPYRAGRGPSDPHPFFLSLARDARDMWLLADRLGLKSVVLIGHSQGAFVARDMLLKQPERCAAVVSEDSASFGTLRTAITRVGAERFDAEDRAQHEKYRATLEFLKIPWEYPSDHNVSRILMRRAGRKADDEWKTQQIPDPEDAPVPGGRWCPVPLLVFAAGRGRIRPTDPEAVELAATLPGEDARLVVVTKSGHGIHEEQTETYVREILEFLNRVPAAERGTER
jgi:pimeloyl-ACP methyl ester carboxylesterase